MNWSIEPLYLYYWTGFVKISGWFGMNINRRLPGCHFHACSPLRPVSAIAHTSAKRAAAAQSKHIYQVYHIILWEVAKAGSVLPNTWPQKRKKEKENTPIYKPFLFYVISCVRVMELKILELQAA